MLLPMCRLFVLARGYAGFGATRAVSFGKTPVEVDIYIPQDGGNRHGHDESEKARDLAAHHQRHHYNCGVELDAVALYLWNEQVVLKLLHQHKYGQHFEHHQPTLRVERGQDEGRYRPQHGPKHRYQFGYARDNAQEQSVRRADKKEAHGARNADYDAE